MAGLGRRFISSTVWVGFSQAVTYILSAVANIILLRLLTPDDFGIFALALSILSFFYLLSDWSFSVAVIQVEEMDQDFFDTACVLTLALGCGVFENHHRHSTASFTRILRTVTHSAGEGSLAGLYQ